MYNGRLESSFSSIKFAEPFVHRRSRAGELLHVGRWRRRLVHAVAHRMRYEDDVSIMVYGRPDPSEIKTRSEVRRVEVSNQPQTTNYYDHHEKASGGRGCSDRAVVVHGQGRTRDSGTGPNGFAGTERKKLLYLVGRGSEPKRSRNWLWNETSP